MIFLIFRIFMRNLNGLCGYYHHPNVGVNLPWSGYPGLHLNQGENPKVFGSSFKTIQIHVASLEHLHPTPANTPFHSILQQHRVTPAPLLY
jgi:hypothetical protein